VGLELVITWMNRLLFLKLLEAQLMTYHKGDTSYSFLKFNRIRNFTILNSLFFDVLAKTRDDRDENIKQNFEKIPYLNSSLFDQNEIEEKVLIISGLDTEKKLPLSSSTVLKDRDGKRLTGEINPLEYLFRFLDSYDFASEGAEEVQEKSKTLISASVLGLIFEKINGYKEGSYFTPGFITMYMCRETIRRAVVQKFNEVKGWNCKDFDELYDHIGINITARNEANEIINSLKICDPAVGSGHFLVSALNEIIAIKSDLQILQDSHGKRLKYHKAEVINDDLMLTDEDGEFFRYRPKNDECRRIQKTLFHEKQTIIENCLFGADINPNAEKICCLRLWIELLKHAYYKDNDELETLPNIDINIKCGNSLISRFALHEDMKLVLKRTNWTIDRYRNTVRDYQKARNKEKKDELKNFMAEIKRDFRADLGSNNPKVKQLNKMEGELNDLITRQELPGMEESAKEKKAKEQKQKRLEKEIADLRAEVEEFESGKIYSNALEWRFEFPEVLNDDGDFMGFDVVIGNPPYVVLEDDHRKLIDLNYYRKNYKAASYKVDLYHLFFEQGINILKKNKFLHYITPSNYLTNNGLKPLRELIMEKTFISKICVIEGQVFDEASVDTALTELFYGKLLEKEKIEYKKWKNSILIITNQNEIPREQHDFPDPESDTCCIRLKTDCFRISKSVPGRQIPV